MEKFGDKNQGRGEVHELTTFPVLFKLKEIKENITINTNTPSKPSKEQLIKLAFKFHSQGNIQEAAKCYQNFINQGFKDPRVFSNYGIILNSYGKLKEAEVLFRKAIELKPESADSYSNLGNLLKDLGKFKEAELSCQKAIELKPDFSEAYFNLGIIFKDLGKLQEAENSFRKAIELNPNLADAYSNLGSIQKDLGKLQEAELSTRKAIELNPNLAEAHSNLGMIMNDLGRSKEAKLAWLKAIEIKPSLEESSFYLAEQLYNQKKYDLAINYLKGKSFNRSKSLYLGCLLCLDRKKDFDRKYLELSKNKICNAEIGGIIEHANIIYDNDYNSSFCNKAAEYVLWDKIKEDLFPDKEFNQLLKFVENSKTEDRIQGLLKNGFQTSGNLFSLDYPFIKSIKKALQIKIELYKQKFKHCNEGFINNWPKKYELRSWIISMKSGGFLQQHNHEYGWITGSFYLQVPKNKNNKNSGSLAFSYQGPKYPLKNKKFHSYINKVEERDICIFPSSLFHKTIPFHSDKKRICFVFDLI